MWSNEIHLELKGVVRINLDYTQQNGVAAGDERNLEEEEEATDSSIGGFLADGLYAWVAKGSHLDVVCTRSGEKLLSHNFECDSKTRNCTVCSVHGMEQSEVGSYVVAVGIQLYGNAGAVVVLTVQGARVLGRIDVNEKISCVQPVSRASYGRGRVSQYNGCLAVGTVSGKVLLIDACLRYETSPIFGQRQVMNRLDKNQCHVEFANVDVATNHELVRQREVYFGLQLECSDDESSPVITLLDLPSLMAIAVGYADGRMVLYDLLELRTLHVAYPPVEDSPIISMNLVEPTNDPKACVYIWTFHAGVDGAFAVLHTLMYEEKYAEPEGHVYERFISCSPRLNISCYDKGSFPLGVQSIMKTVSQEEEVLTLCVLSWVTSDRSTNILVFDLNQWYKAEMPFSCDWRHELNHTVFFSVKDVAMNTRLIVDSLIPFNSIHRPEEHFYPNSLSFDIMTLNNGSCARYHWIGLQNKILEYLEQMGSSSVMNPGKLYNVMLRAALIPQFIDYNFTTEAPVDVQRDFMLSVALEYNCYSLLRECAVSWADGSHLGQEPGEGVSLSTLTTWIWSRAKALKDLSNLMCVPLFDLSGRRIDCGTQKTLLHCSRQLKQLAKLYDVILVQCKQYIPDKVFKSLKSQGSSIQLAADYQEVVQWLLNVGLLPEGNIDGVNLSEEFLLVPFPYPAIRTYFASQRTLLSDKHVDDGNPGSVEDQSCKYLFIDNFIEREFKSEALRKVWLENNATGVYPPNSMQNVLRALLIPNVSVEVKYVLLCYTFMDMTAVLGDGRYGGIIQNLIKFPAVFKLNSAIIKRTQAFWFLDHGNIDNAIEELLSPMSQSEQFPHWQREFLISALLRYDAPHLALRVLRAPGIPISPFLELKTLLENNLISEAFKLQRSKHDTNLLRCFFEGTLKSTKYEVLLDLALSDEETRILREYLTKTTQPMADNVHFMHLLQKLDFVEAVHMIEKLGRKRSVEYNLEAPREALTLYHAALEPTTQHLSYLAYAEQKELKPSKAPYAEPLSSRLIRGRADFRSRIYHKSIISIKEAAEPIEHAQPFLEKPGLGMFQFRSQIKSSNVCYPIKLDSKIPKRKLDDDVSAGDGKTKTSEIFIDYEKPKKRRKLDSTDNSYQSSLVAPKSVLTEFRPTKPCFNFTSKNFQTIPEKSLSRSPSAQLTTPLVHKRQPYNPPSPESVSSYTPHGILRSTTSVQSFVNRKSLSPTSVSMSTLRGNSGAEEKVLRFDLPESPLVEKCEPPSFLVAGVKSAAPEEPANVSLVSNDEFFSPEGSVVLFGDEDASCFLSSGPKRRPSIHSRSRSVTPVENNIAIIIEDNVDDDSTSKQHEVPLEDMPEAMMEDSAEEQTSSSPVLKATCSRKPLGRLVLEANARKALEAELALTTADEELELEIVPGQDVEMVDEVGNSANIQSEGTLDVTGEAAVPAEVVVGAPEMEQLIVEDVETKVVEKSEVTIADTPAGTSAEDNVEQSKVVYADEPADEDDPEDLDDLVVIDRTSSDESVDSGDEDVDVAESSIGESDLGDVEEDSVQNSEASVEEIIDISSSSEKVDSQQESSDGDSSDSDGDGSYEQQSSSANSIILDDGQPQAENDGAVLSGETNNQAGGAANTNYADFYSDTVPDVIMDQQIPEPEVDDRASSDAQVSTTTSSAESNVEVGEDAAQPQPERDHQRSGGESSKNQAQDLTVPQEGAAADEENPERAPELSSSSSVRDLSVVGNERPEQSLPDAELKLISPSRDESFKPKTEEKFLGKPKNAHEVDIPAMNLSVKPDEAHGANRKNSKSDESDDSAALNLSTGQLAEPLRVDEPLSGSEHAEEDAENVIVARELPPQLDPVDPMEGPSTARISTKKSGQEIPKLLSKTTSLKAETPVTPRRSRRLSVDSGEASTSTPRSNVRTRRMSAMEKIEETDVTPSKRMTRASSVAPPDTSSPPSTPLSKGKRHSSMTNLATPDHVTLTPRRSTRASSLAKELLTSTPTRRRRLSVDPKEIVEPGPGSPGQANESFTADDAKSEISNVSVSSRRSLRRKPAVQPAITEEDVPSSPQPSSSTEKVQEESFAEYTTNRRLTRHQSAVIEKSLEMVRKIGTIPEDSENASVADDHSDSESVTSNASNSSKRSKASQVSKGRASRGKLKPPAAARGVRSTRSTTSSKKDGSDAESIETDSPSRKIALETISEETDEPSRTTRRGRPKKTD